MALMLNSEGKSEWEHEMIEARLTLAMLVSMLINSVAKGSSLGRQAVKACLRV
jgi:hypothetical protein